MDTLAVTSPPPRAGLGPPRLVVGSTVPLALPPTQAQRRRERLRARGLASLPFLLLLAAALPRLWAPDLVPFGAREAAELREARQLASSMPAEARPGAWAAWLSGVESASFATQLHALVVDWPGAVVTWVVLLGLLDSATSALVFLAARTLAGPGPAVLAASLYAAAPWVWPAAPDPALATLRFLTAAALLAALALVRRPRAGRACLLGALGALLIRTEPAGLVFVLPLVATMALARPSRRVLLVGTISLGALGGPAMARATEHLAVDGLATTLTTHAVAALIAPVTVFAVGAGLRRNRPALLALVWTALPLALFAVLSPPATPAGSGGPAAPLRFWQAVADAATEAADLTGARELQVLAANGPPSDGASLLASLLEGQLAVRPLPAGLLGLPTDHEALYLLLPGAEAPAELSWPSARLAAVQLPGTDWSARLVSLRARPAAHWLARASNLPEARFADGTVLVGATGRLDRSVDALDLELYWAFGREAGPQATLSRLATVSVDVGGRTRTTRVALPPPEARRAGELVAHRVTVGWPEDSSGRPGVVSIALVGDDDKPVPPADGATDAVQILTVRSGPGR